MHIHYLIICLYALCDFQTNRINKITFVFVSLFSLNFTFIHTVPTESIDSLVDKNKILTSPVELHLTSPEAPIINNTISLNHTDAWLFFDNIKAAVVIDNYIRVNNQPLQVDRNARITIYGDSTVSMPYGATFRPLAVYSVSFCVQDYTF